MEWHHSVTRRVEFSDTDMAGIVHFSKYFCYMEFAEHDFFRKLGFSINRQYGDYKYGWPRIKVKGEFHHPLRFEEEIEILLRLNKINSRSLEFQFKVIKHQDGIIAASGCYSTVCVIHDGNGSLRSTLIPEGLVKLLKSHEWANGKSH